MQFLTLLLLSYIRFPVFLYVLFSRKKNQKLPAHGFRKSLTPRLGNSTNIPRLSLVWRLCLPFQSREQKNSLHALPSSYGTHAQTLLFLFLYWNWHALLLKRCRFSFWYYLLQVDCSRRDWVCQPLISLRNFVARPSIIILYRYAKSQIEAIWT